MRTVPELGIPLTLWLAQRDIRGEDISLPLRGARRRANRPRRRRRRSSRESRRRTRGASCPAPAWTWSPLSRPPPWWNRGPWPSRTNRPIPSRCWSSGDAAPPATFTRMVQGRIRRTRRQGIAACAGGSRCRDKSTRHRRARPASCRHGHNFGHRDLSGSGLDADRVNHHRGINGVELLLARSFPCGKGKC